MCDFVVGKNYRLQDIQLSKSLRSSFQLSTLSFQLVERRLRAELSPHSISGPPSRLALRRDSLSLLHSLACRAEARLAWLRCRPGVSGAKAGEYRARTGDLLVANQALSQLS
jgi:hypothetical protein